MSVRYDERFATHPADAKSYDTNRLRDEYLVQNVMEEGSVNLTYSQYDRLIVGGAVPTNKALVLETIDPLKAEYFLETLNTQTFFKSRMPLIYGLRI